MTLFGGTGNSMVTSDLFKSLLDTNKTLAGNPVGIPRISIKGGRFREIIGGEQTRVFKGDKINLIIANAAPLARTYYEGAYDPNNSAAPACWSSDTRVPSPDVPEAQKMSSSCTDCPMNIKGSGQGDTRACRFSQRLAVVLEGDPENTVYQMQLPATSIFGEANKGLMGMQAYAKLLGVHSTPITAIVTEMSFDEDTETPKLYFKPVRPLDEDELRAAVDARDSDAAKAALTMTVSQGDGVKPKSAEPKAKAKARAKPAPVEDDEDEAPAPKVKARAKPAPVEDDEDEEPAPKVKARAKPAPVEDEEDEDAPIKRTTKPAAVAETKTDLASIIGQWDDDDDE
jgi:hypothetical protein